MLARCAKAVDAGKNALERVEHERALQQRRAARDAEGLVKEL